MPIFSSGYPEKTSNSDEDRFLISDSIDSNKIKGTKWSTIKSSIRSYVEGFTDWITTSMLKDGAVTPEKRSGGFKIGTTGLLSSTGIKSFTGVGFKPKYVRFSLIGAGSNPIASEMAIGAMDENGSQFYSVLRGSTVNAQHGDDGCLGRMTSGGTLNLKASFVSMDDDGFTINVSVANIEGNFAYEAYA